MFCPNCGFQVSEDDRFCRTCGKQLTGTTPAPEPEPSVERDADQPTQDDAALYGYGDPNAELPTISRPRGNPWEFERQRVRADVDENWSMSDLGPPPPRPRRLWLWVIIGILAVMVIACCLFFSWVTFTDSGKRWIEGQATSIAIQVEATNQALGTPMATPTGDN